MSMIKAQQILGAMQNLELKAQGKTLAIDSADDKVEKFSNILMQQLNNINEAQNKAEELQDKFTLGDPNVSLVEVKAAELKASIGTHGLVYVRNEVVKAYNEIMNMSI